MKVETFIEEKMLAEGLMVKRIGGHSIGSCIVLCHCNDKDYVLCGDECYVKECFDKQIPTGATCVPEISERFVQEYSKSSYKQLLFHDPSILNGKLGYAVEE